MAPPTAANFQWNLSLKHKKLAEFLITFCHAFCSFSFSLSSIRIQNLGFLWNWTSIYVRLTSSKINFLLKDSLEDLKLRFMGLFAILRCLLEFSVDRFRVLKCANFWDWDHSKTFKKEKNKKSQKLSIGHFELHLNFWFCMKFCMRWVCKSRQNS